MTIPAAIAGERSVSPATERLLDLVEGCRYEALPASVVDAARWHIVDTVGVMLAGARQGVTERAERVIASVRKGGDVPAVGRGRRADLLDAAFLGGTSAHGLELDDGYREGSIHPGVAVIPAALVVAFDRRSSGKALVEAVVAGYEVVTALGRACHPHLRRQGFHPTAAIGAFGAAAAAAKLRGASRAVVADAVGVAASAASGLFAFVAGGADVKRLHAGHAAREGLFAVLLAERGVAGPPRVLEGRDGFFQAFATEGAAAASESLVFASPAGRYGIADCYFKPYACCRHLHPSIDALLWLVREHGLRPDEVEGIRVETYRIAAEHANVPWDDFAAAQLSFRYVLATALRHGAVDLEHFSPERLVDVDSAALCARVEVTTAPDLDARYPAARPARVTVRARGGSYSRQVLEALGSPELPLEPDALRHKFRVLAGPAIGQAAAAAVLAALERIEEVRDVAPLVEQLALARGVSA